MPAISLMPPMPPNAYSNKNTKYHLPPTAKPSFQTRNTMSITKSLPASRHLISINKDVLDEDPWIHNSINISDLFKVYQIAIMDIITKHKTMPLESYTHKLAALTDIFILSKDQHNLIVFLSFFGFITRTDNSESQSWLPDEKNYGNQHNHQKSDSHSYLPVMEKRTVVLNGLKNKFGSLWQDATSPPYQQVSLLCA